MSNLLLAAFAAAAITSPGATPPLDAIKLLREGNQRFASGLPEHPNQSAARRRNVAKKQTPHTVVLTCADSRVTPEILFDQGIGDLFVVRVAGNTLDKRELGSIEYAVEHLGARLVVVLGHTNCGAVKAAFDAHGHLPGAIGTVVDPIIPAVRYTHHQMGDRLTNAVLQNVRMVVAKMTKADEVMKECVKHGKVKVVGAVYDLDSGVVDWVR